MKIRKLPYIGSAGVKLVLVGVLLLLFIIPLEMIKDVIRMRSSRSLEVQGEIVNSWGGESLLSGAYLVVPYTQIETTTTTEGTETTIEKVLRKTEIILPDETTTIVNNTTELRYRGIYSVPVFNNEVQISGHFNLASHAGKEERTYKWEEASLGYCMPSMRALSTISAVDVATRTLTFEPGGTAFSSYEQILAPWPGLTGVESELPFNFTMDVRGGDTIMFLPLARSTTVRLTSDWSAPSFIGAFLPNTREITDAGTSAYWKVDYLSRSIPQNWTTEPSNDPALAENDFGVSMIDPVDAYQKITRITTRGLLFLLVPFLVFFLFEFITGRRIHPVQYFMAGLGDVIFYLLLLSLSEHIGFNLAYLISALSISVMLTLYAGAAFSSRNRGLIMAAILACYYGYYFVLLQSEDYALLLGSVGLFVSVAVMMFFTRKIDWYKSSNSAGFPFDSTNGGSEPD